MTIREQIITVKVTYDDYADEGCSQDLVEGCCGSVCENTNPSAAANIISTMECCGHANKIEVLQATEPREVLTEQSFGSNE